MIKEDYKDDILDTDVNVNRRYTLKDNNENILYEDISIEDTTDYIQEGDYFGAKELNLISKAINEMQSQILGMRSHIGMIIQSTTLDTMDKVIELYGGSRWEKIEGKFLLGSSQSHTVNSTGGSEDAVVVSHTHSENANGAHQHYGYLGYAWIGNGSSGGQNFALDLNAYNSTTQKRDGNVITQSNGSHSHTINSTGSSGTGKNMPPYKAVYIWERVE